jgi:hypothetical protein
VRRLIRRQREDGNAIDRAVQGLPLLSTQAADGVASVGWVERREAQQEPGRIRTGPRRWASFVSPTYRGCRLTLST